MFAVFITCLIITIAFIAVFVLACMLFWGSDIDPFVGLLFWSWVACMILTCCGVIRITPTFNLGFNQAQTVEEEPANENSEKPKENQTWKWLTTPIGKKPTED